VIVADMYLHRDFMVVQFTIYACMSVYVLLLYILYFSAVTMGFDLI